MAGGDLAALLPNCPYVLDAARPKPRPGAWWTAVRRRRGGPTSSGKLHHSSIDERRKLTEEVREAYHDRIVRAHAEYLRLQEQKRKGSAGGAGVPSGGALDRGPGAGGAVGGPGGGGGGGGEDKGVEGSSAAGAGRGGGAAAVTAGSGGVPVAAGDGGGLATSAEVVEVVASVLQNHHTKVLKASAELENSSPGGSLRRVVPTVISEKITSHLIAIATALVSDCSFALRTAVAADPRIQARCIKSKRQLEKATIRKYQREMSEKRKDKLVLNEAATTLALSGLSSKAFCAVRSVLQKLGCRGVLFPEKALREARKELEELAIEDLRVYETPDGWFVSARAAIEMEILRIMQEVHVGKGARTGAGDRVTGIGPGGHGWQDHFDVKLTLDARRITRRISQTEVMLLIIPKEDGVDRCQKAVHIRTIGVWTGKDSRDNVQANTVAFFKEIQDLQANGVLYCPIEDKLLGIWDKYKDCDEAARAEKRLSKVTLDFWHGGDMASQCAVLGQGCAGHLYCGHCNAHKEQRHIPYALLRVQEAINFKQLAEDHDMWPRTLHAINAGTLAKGGLTEHGLQACTADADFSAEAEEAEQEEATTGIAGVGGVGGPGGVIGSSQAAACSGLRAPPRPSRGARKQRKVMNGVCKGPSVEVLKTLTAWSNDHPVTCRCKQCVVPPGTVVRVIPRLGDDNWRESEWLRKHWPSHSQKRFPFCALHCLMRITEAMFLMITQRCLKNESVIGRLNQGLTEAGICKQFSKTPGASGVHTYEKLTFEGHQALRLLAKQDGKMAVVRILEGMWPSGSCSDHEDGRDYVPRQQALWAQWSEVVSLMTERDPVKVAANRDGFARFAKECREFCHQYQAMYHQEHCRSFYLHTLLHHAGDFMRELQEHGMCLGMMANSGAERRHEYGRRAAKKALVGGCWRSKNPRLASMRNLLAYLTLKEILIWQHGSDLVSHERARRAASLDSTPAGPVESRRAVGSGLSSAPESGLDTVALCAEIGLEKDPTLDSAAEIADEPAAVDLLAELVYEGVECKTEGPLPEGVKRRADGVAVYDVEEDVMLHQGRDEHWEVMSQESAVGSDDEDEDDEVRINDLAALRGDWLPDEDDSDDGDFDGLEDAEDDEDDGEVSACPPALRLRLSRKCSGASATPGLVPAAQAAAADGGGNGSSLAQALAQDAELFGSESLNGKTVQQLKEMCRERGITGSNVAKKSGLSAALLRWAAEHNPPPLHPAI